MTKRELIEELLRLTQLQSKSLKDGNVDGFIALLDKRQIILDEIQKLHEEKTETKEQHEEDLVTMLKALDEENRVEFERQFEEVKTKLRQARQLKQREQHYNNPYDMSWEEGVFFDKKERR
ncbi:flagellar protein FliT [Cellulosilyticum ruminicola]|uniref:flagellar protein FliT n=1 Tax=Cellulosilyticum ruminicola TaxID=425254 RepID=UPI0006D10423|nr:flagellar protein FliT [Cellulosilyticum ruminicola]